MLPIQADLKAKAETLIHITLTERQLCDLELILNGAFSPLEGFLGEKDYKSVVENLRLADGTLWTIPVYLDIAASTIKELDLKEGSEVMLFAIPVA